MRLAAVELNGFRRFENARCDMEGHLLAIVGPNEAGKTSLLRALEHLSNDRAFQAGERTTDSRTVASDVPVVSVLFALERDDLDAIDGIQDAKRVRWLLVHKDASGEVWSKVVDPPTRDLKPRQRCLRGLQRAARSRWATQRLTADPEDTLAITLQRTVELLDTDEELEPPTLEMLRGLVSLLRRASAPPSLAQSIGTITSLLAHEEAEHPANAATRALAARRPAFLWFGDVDRTLQSEYEIAQVDPTRGALANLAAVARLDLRKLQAEMANIATRRTLLEEANARLTEVFRAAWQQSSLTVHFDADGTRLYVHARDEGIGYTSIAERSDGARAFVALYAFLQAHRMKTRPILLVDEAETHLHYDAQADLVRAFTRQDFADVIYTTHSAGCLPEDLGTGIVVVAPERGVRRSRLSSSFWTEGAGFSPLLLAMGASALAFTPTRRAVITEGPSDALLLPTLLREATGRESLGFQMAPGLAEVTAEAVQRLDLEAARVVYLVDGDKGGRAAAGKLAAAGLPVTRVFVLGNSYTSGLAAEDFVAAGALTDAVNEALFRSGIDRRVTATDLPPSSRWRWLRTWCGQHGIPVPDKMAVVQLLLASRQHQRLVAPARRRMLIALHGQLGDALVGPRDPLHELS